jgi:hypothetical protein
MTTKEHEITRENAGKSWTDDDWVIFNLRDTAYYLTNYDETLWSLITSSLAKDHEAIHFLNRGTLFADSFRFIQQAIDFRATTFLKMMDSLKLEHHQHVWSRADQGMRLFELRLRGSELHGMHLNFVKDLMTEIHGREFGNSTSNTINFLSCVSGVQTCIDDALQALADVMDTGSTDFPFEFRCNAFRVADEATWMHFFDLTMSLSPVQWERRNALRDLECTQNPKLIQHVLDTVLDLTNNLEWIERRDLVEFMARENVEGYNAVIEFISKHHDFIDKQ